LSQVKVAVPVFKSIS